jgi:phospholipid/cholesterol/gamma-HCH transport system substrate-binding protein
MPQRSNIEWKVGIFVFIGVIILCIGIFSIGNFGVFKAYHIKVKFTFASGVEVGSPVRLAGVEVGEISRIELHHSNAEEYVLIVAKVRQSAQIPCDSTAVINMIGILGERYLEIAPGKRYDKLLKDNEIIVGKDPVSLEEIIELTHDIAANLREITRKIKDGEGTVGKFLCDETVYKNFEYLSEDLKRNPWKVLFKGKEKPVILHGKEVTLEKASQTQEEEKEPQGKDNKGMIFKR